MLRLMAGVLLCCVLTLTACQTYTATLEKGVAGADETSAVAALRAISLGETSYSLTNSGEFGTLQQLVDGGFLDSRFSGRPAKDYIITLNVVTKASDAPEGFFSCNADPDPTLQRTRRHFYIDSTSSTIHVNPSQPATASDPPLQ
jgi:Tfp pilus assembly protein PilE